MNKNIWDVFAPVYEFSMRSQKNIYDFLYARIAEVAKDKDVLELATGPGMIARHIAPAAKSVVATDFAPKMIETALKAKNPDNLSFEVADATSLRVLKDDGLLISLNFFFCEGGKKNLWQKILSLVGIRFAHEWTEKEYKAFLESNGWKIKMDRVIKGRIDLIYVECA